MTQNIKYMLLATLLLTASMISCNPDELNPDPPIATFVVIDGDTVKTRIDITESSNLSSKISTQIITGTKVITYRSPSLPSRGVQMQDLKPLLSENALNGKRGFKMLAIGGSLMAGARDGGYFNEGIETSIPNLLAKHLGADFKQPYFGKEAYNGVGRNELSPDNITKGPLPKFNTASNNLEVQEGGEYKPFLDDIDNYAFPGILSPLYRPSNYGANSLVFDKGSYRLGIRILENKKSGIANEWSKKDFDFFIFDFSAFEDLISRVTTQDRSMTSFNSYRKEWLERKPMDWEIVNETGGLHIAFLHQVLKDSKRSGILINCPDVSDLPILNWINQELAQVELKKYLSPIYVSEYSKNPSDIFFLPTGSVDSLFSPVVSPTLKRGINKNFPLKYTDQIHRSTYYSLKEMAVSYNQDLEKIGKLYNLPILDLYSIYKTLVKENKITSNGVTVTTKDFFSSDGVNPSVSGNQIITNEIIAEVNRYYKMNIPQIAINNSKE